MKTENEQCDYCKKVTTSFGKKKHDTDCLVLTIGYSRGGWGSRGDFINENPTLCTECYSIMEQQIATNSKIIRNEIYFN